MEQSGTYDDMKGVIGSLISLWVGIERTVEKLDDAAPRQAGDESFPTSVSSRLDHWQRRVQADEGNRPFRASLARRLRQQLREAQKIRNGICHGLQGIAAANREQPGRICWRINGIELSRTWDEMQAHFAWLSKVAFALEILEEGDMSCFARLHDSEENREWWRAEYGIDLPEPEPWKRFVGKLPTLRGGA
ncbi:hypothetical protein [Tabrizicola sp.]|uniref:hypothetical protein n=1 Tax=Tabrizicola sp. TaxID=2005166 RepID=UPI0025F86BEE|nr:hypothetical protein [Tabrizicola sp.]